MFMTLLAAYQTLLHRYTNQDRHRGGDADCESRAWRDRSPDRVLRKHAGDASGRVGRSNVPRVAGASEGSKFGRVRAPGRAV